MRMKRWVAVLCALLMTVLLCSCGNDVRRGDRDNDVDETTSVGDDKGSKRWAIDEARGHYVNSAANPEMSGEGPKADVSEAYFTSNRHLCVKLLFSNGTDHMQKIEAIDVSVYDAATDTMIAGGKATLPDELIVPVAGVEDYTFYISPEHIHVDDTASLPEALIFEVSVDHVAVEAE